MSRPALVVPRRLQTALFSGLFAAGAPFMAALAIFGQTDDGLAFRIGFGVVMTSACLAIALWFFAMGSFWLTADRVRGGWPRSQWIHRDEIERIDFDGSPRTGGLVLLELVDASVVKLVVVNPMFLISRNEVARIEKAIDRLHAALGFD